MLSLLLEPELSLYRFVLGVTALPRLLAAPGLQLEALATDLTLCLQPQLYPGLYLGGLGLNQYKPTLCRSL